MAVFSDLTGKTISEIEGGSGGSVLSFHLSDGMEYRMSHEQECGESVAIEDISGDLDDLIGSPVLNAEESSNSDVNPEGSGKQPDHEGDSFTWTFYRIATIRGSVVIRWYGTSNGHYSERVDFTEVSGK